MKTSFLTMSFVASVLASQMAFAASEPFEVKHAIRGAFGTCELVPSEQKIREAMIQDARLKCGADVSVGDFEIIVHPCERGERYKVIYEIAGHFSCREPQPHVTGKGSAVKMANTGTGLGDVDYLADQNAELQCGGSVVRVSNYEFERVYEGSFAKLTASAQYECRR